MAYVRSCLFFSSNRPIDISAFVPDIPNSLPLTRIYVDGDGGLTNDWRIREHWNPGSAWAGLVSTVPPVRFFSRDR